MGIVIALEGVWMLLLLMTMMYAWHYIDEELPLLLGALGLFLLSTYFFIGLSASSISMTRHGVVAEWGWYSQTSGVADFTVFAGFVLCGVAAWMYLRKRRIHDVARREQEST